MDSLDPVRGIEHTPESLCEVRIAVCSKSVGSVVGFERLTILRKEMLFDLVQLKSRVQWHIRGGRLRRFDRCDPELLKAVTVDGCTAFTVVKRAPFCLWVRQNCPRQRGNWQDLPSQHVTRSCAFIIVR